MKLTIDLVRAVRLTGRPALIDLAEHVAAQRRSAVEQERERAARIVEWADLFWHNGDPRHRIAAAIRDPKTRAPGAPGPRGGA